MANNNGDGPDDPTQANDPAPQTGGTNPWDDSIKQSYQKYLGRTPTSQEVMSHYGNPGGLNGVLDTIKGSDEAKAFSQGQAGGLGAGTSAPGDKGQGMPDGIDPQLAALYQKHNFSPTGGGTGFGDWQYWQDKMKSTGDSKYFLDRLDADLSGTGTDQPTGTVGSGVWSNSGAADRASGNYTPPPTPGVPPPGTPPTSGGGDPIPVPTSPVPTSPIGGGSPTPQDLMAQLIARYQGQLNNPRGPIAGAKPYKPLGS